MSPSAGHEWRRKIEKIFLKGLGLSFDGHKYFDDLDFEIPIGKVMIIEGGSGSGKSILMKAIAALITPSKGDVYYNDISLEEITREEFDLFRLNMAFGFDNGGLLSNRTIRDNIMLPLSYHGLQSHAEAEHMIKEFELTPFEHARPFSLSLAIKKMAGIARSLAIEPQVLFLDEPSLGLSSAQTDCIVKHVKSWKEKDPSRTLICASSDKYFNLLFEHDHYLIEKHSLRKLDPPALRPTG